jgi:hypothetical protein
MLPIRVVEASGGSRVHMCGARGVPVSRHGDIKVAAVACQLADAGGLPARDARNRAGSSCCVGERRWLAEGVACMPVACLSAGQCSNARVRGCARARLSTRAVVCSAGLRVCLGVCWRLWPFAVCWRCVSRAHTERPCLRGMFVVQGAAASARVATFVTSGNGQVTVTVRPHVVPPPHFKPRVTYIF